MDVPSGSTGLYNVSNTCYLNSVLQVSRGILCSVPNTSALRAPSFLRGSTRSRASGYRVERISMGLHQGSSGISSCSPPHTDEVRACFTLFLNSCTTSRR